MNNLFYLKKHFKNKKVLITGHNGFKGTWMCLIFTFLGAKVIGCGLKNNNNFTFFKFIKNRIYKNIYVDICDFSKFSKIIIKEKPTFIIHLAAQALVFESYKNPAYTFKNNILSSLNLLEILRNYKNKIFIVFVTSDKVYKNNEKLSGYTENDVIGGDDPYSASKASIEMILNSYIKSYLLNKNNVKISIARAGNVIGGGDWSKNRIIPDIIRSYFYKKKFIIRSPESERPWQHVLEPLFGYIQILVKLSKNKIKNGSIYNFGPSIKNTIKVKNLMRLLSNALKKENNYSLNYSLKKSDVKETNILRLNSSKANKQINWKCKLSIIETIDYTAEWYSKFYKRRNNMEIFDFSIKQIEDYLQK
tara:strand:+ start:17969 stop:19054 length:1086 start_codon:yes stop_codon:yes gene_type:complete